MTASARDVAAAIRRRLPGVPTKKLHKLLYYCQGHHLAHFGVPLFAESVVAFDMGRLSRACGARRNMGRSTASRRSRRWTTANSTPSAT
ncbi:MAG: hypothetical protein J2P15_10980 [Micromonosporaceae bacterium]|nr:hypothetical protein [Micromonosporaceae bacterium]